MCKSLYKVEVLGDVPNQERDYKDHNAERKVSTEFSDKAWTS